MLDRFGFLKTLLGLAVAPLAVATASTMATKPQQTKSPFTSDELRLLFFATSDSKYDANKILKTNAAIQKTVSLEQRSFHDAMAKCNAIYQEKFDKMDALEQRVLVQLRSKVQ